MTAHSDKIKGAASKAKRKLRDHRPTCLFPGCSAVAIRSHSQQRATALLAISVDQQVIGVNRNILSMQDQATCPYSIKVASRFWGFCSTHDNDVFKSIEDKALDTSCSQSLFLLFLRTCCFEIAQKRESSRFMRYFYEFGKDFLGSDLKPSLEAEIASTTSDRHSNYLLERLFDIYQKKDWGSVSHKVLELPKNIGLSCSSTISSRSGDIRDWDRDAEKPLPFIGFNIVPSESSTSIIVSWFSEWIDQVQEFWDRYESASLSSILYELAINRSEDALISPNLWNSLSHEQQNSIGLSFRSLELSDDLPSGNLLRIPDFDICWSDVLGVEICQ